MNELEYIKYVIDMHLEWYDVIGRTSDKMFVHEDMFVKQHEEWKDTVYWQPIKSKLNDYDFRFVENKLGFEIPLDFKHVLLYKHFINLRLVQSDIFDIKPTWKDDYLREISGYNIDYSKHKIFPIGSFSDYGLTAIELESNNIIWLDSQYNYNKISL